MEKLKIFLQSKREWIIPVCILLALVFWAGMEYKTYQLQKAIRDTFSDVINTQSDVQTNNSEERSAPEVSNTTDLSKKVDLKILKKGFTDGDYQDSISMSLELTNNSGKELDGVKGTIRIQDLFGDHIKSIGISYDDGLKISEVKLYSVYLEYNQFIDSDIELRNIDLAKMNYEWEVETLVYTDGTVEQR